MGWFANIIYKLKHSSITIRYWCPLCNKTFTGTYYDLSYLSGGNIKLCDECIHLPRSPTRAVL